MIMKRFILFASCLLFCLSALAGDPRLPGLIVTILKNYFGFQDNSKFCAHTYCEVDYFRKDPEDAGNSG